ncbi:uncharacterized protein [Leptinotarsa decemlineata]|uniref:uncharacterized protein n=1 Tax=Leptinotarsa decemlineata TaxID=7539 RepID=UPI003D30C04B
MFLRGCSGTAHTIKHLRHDLLLNNTEESLFEGTDRTFSQVYVEHPYPIHGHLKTSEDLVKIILREKEEYFRQLENERRKFEFDKKNIAKKKYGGSEYIHIPNYLIEFYQQKDPNPSFNCDYNYYYTGGVLEHIEFNKSDYLIRPDVDNNLLLTDVNNSSDTKKINYSSPTPIYGLNSLKTEQGLLLILREKLKVSIFQFDNIFSINLLWAKDFKVPIFDAKLNEDEPNHLGVVTLSKFTVEDIKVNATLFYLKNNVETNTDNFQQFQFLGSTLLVLMDRYRVRILDYKSKTEEVCSDLNLIDCNSFCTFNVLENTLLLASRHYIIKSDLRYLTEISYYSHSLNEATCYMDNVQLGQDTYLCVAGQNVSAKVLFTGNSPYSLPYKVPSIMDTLKESRLVYPGLVLEKYLDNRLNYSTTGLKILNLDEEVLIFSVNSLGEIFKQKVSDKKLDIQRPTEILFEWTKYQQKPDPVQHLTLVEEASKVRFALNSNSLEHKLQKFKLKGKAAEFLDEFAPMCKKKHVQGTFALDFLRVWEDDEEEEDEHVGDLPEVHVHDKVTNWIQTHDFSDDETEFSLLNISQGSQKI